MNKNCLKCQKQFFVPKYRIDTAKFCSQSCLAKFRTGDKAANWKGGEKPSFCSECRSLISNYRAILCRRCNDVSRRGEANPFWKGGATSLIRSMRTMYEYNVWRKAVFVRDNYCCVECGANGITLNVDHIKPFSVIVRKNDIKNLQTARECMELWDVSNGRTLCIPCHKKTPTFGFKMNKLQNIWA